MSLLRKTIQAIRSAFTSKSEQNESKIERNEYQSNSAQSIVPASSVSDELASFTLCRGDRGKSRCFVEFIGGPLDGHMEGLPVSPEELAVTIAIPVSPVCLGKLSGKLPPIIGAIVKPTSVAFYERDIECLIPPRFLFVGAARVDNVRALWANKD